MLRFFFEFGESTRIALASVWSNKLRAVLTTLGIIIGIVSVTGMATVMNGIEKGFEQDIASLGSNVIYVEKWPWVRGPSTKWWEMMNRPNMTESLADALNSSASMVETATAVVSTSRTLKSKTESMSAATVTGAQANYPSVHEVDLSEGYFFNEFDNQSARHVVVVGAKIAEELYPFGSAFGKELNIDGARYTIIGILTGQGSATEGPASTDYSVQIPFNAFKQQFGTRWRDVSIQSKIGDGFAIADAKDQMRGVLRLARKLDAKDADNFEINEQESLRAAIEPIKNAIFAIGIGLTALALLVGGIGVMNIMFVTVKERTREIGVRKAVGARRVTILVQFLVEAVVICMVGGIVGVGLAFPLSMLIGAVLPASLDLPTVFMAFGMCVAIGITFGLAPAWSAAKAPPIEALRYE